MNPPYGTVNGDINFWFLFLIDRFRVSCYRFSVFMWNHHACRNFPLSLIEAAIPFDELVRGGGGEGGVLRKDQTCYHFAMKLFFFFFH